MGRKLLIVASKRYGDYVKEIAESMGWFEEISFVDKKSREAVLNIEFLNKKLKAGIEMQNNEV